jgi:sugar phosphate isomerase/epimerase
MYKNLNPESLGISARHNELIELALTHKFRGFDIDIQELMRQVGARGREHAMRFLQSANVKIGSFELPIDLAAPDDRFQSDLDRLEEIAALSETLDATRSIASVLPYNIDRAYHENFELHRERIGRVAQILAPHQIQLGLGFIAPKVVRERGDSEFIATASALLTLIQTVGEKNVGLCLDTWHWRVAGAAVDQLKNFPVNQIVMVRLADLPVDAQLDTISEEQRLLPGATGVVPNLEWIRLLGDRGYVGPVTAYCHPSQFTGSTRAQTVEQAAEALHTLMQSARESDADVGETHAAAAR